MMDRPGGAERRSTVLIVSQTYVPDPAAVGQHVADVAAELARRGWRVVVLASGRGYADPSVRYPARERIDGVEVRRLPLASFGKGSIAMRVLGAASFLSQALVRGLFVRRLRTVFVSTSPPMAGIVALAIRLVRRVPFVFWAMDINPDQAVALGKARAGSLAVRAFDALNRRLLGRARAVVALDRYMAERLERKRPLGERLAIVPPWPPADEVSDLPLEGNAFRRAHGLEDKFVFMYSGNHSPAHPIATVLGAASRLRERDDIVFVFVGGGLGKREVDAAVAAGAVNVRSLPYEPLSKVRESLSAADVHLVTFGDDMVGIVHPSKVYGAMAVSRPFVLIGPRRSHVGDLIDEARCGWQLEHGDVDGAAALFAELADLSSDELAAFGRRGADAIRVSRSRPVLCAKVADCVEDRAG